MDNLTAKDTERDPTARTNGRIKHLLKIEKGMTLGGIARSFDVTVHDLMNWNSMASEDKLTAGSQLAIWLREDQNPAGSEVAPEEQVLFADAVPTARVEGGKATAREAVRVEATAAAAPGEHTVKRGETLASIAQTFEVTIENLMDWNDLDDTSIRSGSTLKVEKQDARTAQEKPAVKKEASAVERESAAVKQEKPVVKKTTQTTRQEKSKSMGGEANPAAEKTSSESPQVKAKDDTVHVVAKGETLFRIARKYDVSVDDVIKWNALPDPGIRIGQKLRIVRNGSVQPVAAAPADAPDASVKTGMTAAGDQPAVAKKSGGMYTVQAGDNLYSISRAHGVSVEDLRKWNSLKSNAVQTGQKLRVTADGAASTVVPATNTGVPVASEATDRGSDTTVVVSGKKIVITRHTVEKGESLNSIARDYGVRVADLRMWNKLAGDQVTIGQQLLVRAGAGASAEKGAGEEASQAGSRQDTEVPGQGQKQEYVVQKGETLYSIARKLNVTVTQLRNWNKIGRFLDIGQKLVYYSGN
jgi:membrane-bound lytic murein transglycosylase D